MESYSDYQSKFEIEERVQSGLPVQYHKQYQELRETSSSSTHTRIPTTFAREKYWSRIANKKIVEIIAEFSKSTDNNSNQENMTEAHSQTAMGQIIADTIQQGIARALARNTNNQQEDKDFYTKPLKYNGDRDRFKIDNWISSVEDYQSFRGWDDEKTFRFAKTLLVDMAAIWLRNINDLSDHKISTWVSLKSSIVQQFRPTNTIIQLREQLHSLTQKTTISEYIKEFLTIRLGIPRMSDDEAVDKFTRGLKNKDVRAQIRGLYRNECPPSLNEAIQTVIIGK